MPHSPLSDGECRLALESSAAGFAILDEVRSAVGLEDFALRYVNRTAAGYIGRPAEELAGRRVTEIIPHAWDQPGPLQRFASVLATGTTAEFDQRISMRGVSRWFRITAARNGDGVAVWFADITQLKNTEEQLNRSEIYLIEAQRLSHYASWVFDPASGEVTWSPEHYTLFGIEPKTGTLSIDEALAPIHPEDRPRCHERLLHAIENRHELDEHFRIVWPNGEIRHIHSIGRPRLDDGGQLIELIGSALDTTEQVQASKAARTIQAELARASRVMTLGELTTSIAHEVNQPLAALVSNADAALRWLGRMHEGGLEKARTALQHVVEEGHRAGKVIAHIRSLARTDVADRAPVNLNEAILEVTRLLQLELNEAGVTLCTAFDETLPPVLGDRIQLQHMLLNLLRNAMEATSGQPVREVIVGTWPEAGRVRIRIEDTGVGFDPQVRTRIFEPFYTTKADGMGIGLSVCRTVVEAHHGRIWAELNENRPGATFHCELPLEVSSAPATTRPRS